MQITTYTNRKVVRVFPHAALTALAALGPSIPEAVLFHLEKILGVPPEKVFEDPLKFASALETLFSSGSTLIEDKIIHIMCEELHVKFQDTRGTFEEKLTRNFSNGGLGNGTIFELGALEQTMR